MSDDKKTGKKKTGKKRTGKKKPGKKTEEDPDLVRLGAVLKSARIQAGFSQRELAVQLGRTHVAISNAEKGSDLRFETLRAYLKAFPHLTPRDLFRPGDHEVAMTPEEVWRYYRDLAGCEAAEVQRRLTVQPDGGREGRVWVNRLRSLPGRHADLRVVHGLENAAFEGSPTILRELQVADAKGREDAIRSRVLDREGRFLQQVVVPERLAREGVSFGWVNHRSDRAVFHEDYEARVGPTSDPVQAGFTFQPTYPVRSLLLQLRFHPGYWPKTVQVRVWPAAVPPDPDMADLAPHLHDEGLKLKRDRRRGTVTCRVDRPLIGLSYSMGWVLPSRTEPE
ncbi:MAG: helix-turn-helix transcriptional regulator [Acidobacteriota bacterium]